MDCAYNVNINKLFKACLHVIAIPSIQINHCRLGSTAFVARL